MQVEVSTPDRLIDAHGMVMDFADLDFVGDIITSAWDHRHLNDLMERPTSELIAEWFGGVVADHLSRLVQRGAKIAVTVRESPRTFARWESSP